MINASTKDILDVSSLTPQDVDGELHYSLLEDRVNEYTPEEAKLWHEFSAAEQGSIKEAVIARKLGSFFLLKTAETINTSKYAASSEQWASHFTVATEELYDTEVSAPLWNELIQRRLTELRHMPNQEAAQSLRDRYQELGWNVNNFSGETREDLPVPEKVWGEYLKDKFNFILTLIDDANTYNPDDLKTLFERAIGALHEDGNFGDWGDWQVDLDETRSSVMVIASKKKISIGGKRSRATAKDAKYLVGHELLTHALRAQYGYMHNDELLAKGMPAYLAAEEGLAVINGFVMSGKLPAAMVDRYIDIGIAKGYLGVIPSRQDMIEMDCLRRLANTPHRDPSESASKYINRIYRGGVGNVERGKIQPINTKDVVYYKGYMKMVNYINKALSDGTTPQEIFDTMYYGKIDPTSCEHLEYAERRAGRSIDF